MANIKISDLQPVGFGLFSDSESYMRELSEGELSIQGGFLRTIASLIGSGVWDAVSYVAHELGVPDEAIRVAEEVAEGFV